MAGMIIAKQGMASTAERQQRLACISNYLPTHRNTESVTKTNSTIQQQIAKPARVCIKEPNRTAQFHPQQPVLSTSAPLEPYTLALRSSALLSPLALALPLAHSYASFHVLASPRRRRPSQHASFVPPEGLHSS